MIGKKVGTSRKALLGLEVRTEKKRKFYMPIDRPANAPESIAQTNGCYGASRA